LTAPRPAAIAPNSSTQAVRSISVLFLFRSQGSSSPGHKPNGTGGGRHRWPSALWSGVCTWCSHYRIGELESSTPPKALPQHQDKSHAIALPAQPAAWSPGAAVQMPFHRCRLSPSDSTPGPELQPMDAAQIVLLPHPHPVRRRPAASKTASSNSRCMRPLAFSMPLNT